jgi:hypothetical protein
MRYSLIILVVAMVLSLGMSYFWNPVRLAANSDNPAADLHAMTQQDPDLEHALQSADRNDVTELVKWINRADALQRQRLASLLINLVSPKVSDTQREPNVHLVYKYRQRFRAFLTLGTGDDRLDIALENLLAYSVVTATDAPTKQDTDLATLLMPRLRRAANEFSDDALWDTVGCVQFVTGDFAGAKESFATAQKLVREGKSKDKLRRELEELYRRRFEASARNQQLVAEKSAEALAPLPKEGPEEIPKAEPAKEAAAP